MLKNYWKIAWRNLVKDRRFALLNVLGLSVGLACTMLIGLWVADEMKMEKYNANDDRLYQVMVNRGDADGVHTGDYTPGHMGQALQAEMPEVQYASSVLPASWFNPGGVVGLPGKKLKANPQYVDSSYFHIFTCPFVEGNWHSLFSDRQGVAISSSFAQAFFGTTHGLIGKVIHYDRYEFTGDFVIRGVFIPNPTNATEHFDLLFNYALALERRPGLNNWGNSDPSTFVLIRKDADTARLNAKLAHYLRTKGDDEDKSYFLAKFSDRYLYNNYENGDRVHSGGRIVYVRLFGIIAAFILVIACINFMNLSTARATQRAREVGIQKVVGAGRLMLIGQYLGESLLLTFFSLGVALLLVRLMLPVFNNITGKELTLDFAPSFLLIVLGSTVLTGLLAGSYPAFYLSAFRPVAVLKGTIRTSVGELWARKGLVVFQFTLSILLIAGVLIIYRQLKYIQSRDLGYNRENVIQFNIPLNYDSAGMMAAGSFVNELNNIPGVAGAAGFAHDLMGDHGEIGGLHWPGADPNQHLDFANIEIGYNFLEAIGIKLKEGRYFSHNANAQHEIIFNETAIRAMGLKDPIGKVVTFWNERREIVGVAKDFNFESLYQPVKQAFFRCYPVGDQVMVRLRRGSEKQTIAALKAAYARFNPGLAFEYKYMDEVYQRMYDSETRVGILSRYFAGLAILISCLGLFGLAAFSAQRRRKEIGIRKVIGASVGQLVYLMSGEFLALVLLAIAVAFPLAWMGMHSWLDTFAYRVTITSDIFWITGITAIVITLLTISYQSITAAMSNPVHSLRSE